MSSSLSASSIDSTLLSDIAHLHLDASVWPTGLAVSEGVLIAKHNLTEERFALFTDVPSLEVISACEMRSPTAVRWVQCTTVEFERIRQRELAASIVQAALPIIHTSDQSSALNVDAEAVSLIENPVVRFVSKMLHDALKMGASDVHAGSSETGLVIKFRVDGILIPGTATHGESAQSKVLSRIKVLSELNIAEQRRPQDGRFRVQYQCRDVDIRVSIIPGVWGEDAVLRVLDKSSMLADGGELTLDSLGFDTKTLAVIRQISRIPYGLLLITGPTGSGKTTTMYAMLSETATSEQKTVTIEDPIEYRLKDTLQIPVNEATGFSFAVGLRSVLRHDPDRIMIGEIRDRETADIAVQSALTGHPVFSSVHANSAFDVVGRFVHMGLDIHNFTTALNGVVAQRLLRKICRHCLQSDADSSFKAKHVLSSIELAQEQIEWKKGAGCDHCRRTGYSGRLAIMEVVRIDEKLRAMIVSRAPLDQMKVYAQKGGLVTLREQALALGRKGITTLEEIGRVTLAE